MVDVDEIVVEDPVQDECNPDIEDCPELIEEASAPEPMVDEVPAEN